MKTDEWAEDKRLLERIDIYADGCTPWEIEFIESCLRQLDENPPRALTEKQRAVAERIDRERIG